MMLALKGTNRVLLSEASDAEKVISVHEAGRSLKNTTAFVGCTPGWNWTTRQRLGRDKADLRHFWSIVHIINNETANACDSFWEHYV